VNRKIVVIAVLGGVALLATLIYNTMEATAHKVEVCMEFNGQTKCGVAGGNSVELALRTATDNACATISNGMTESIACGNRQPKSVRWIRGGN
jgi:hypothetical protein